MNLENPQSQTLLPQVPIQYGENQSSVSSLLPAVSQEQSDGERELAKFASSAPSFFTTLPCLTSEDFEVVSRLMAVSDAKSKHCANTTIAVVGFAADFGPVGETEDGEVVESLRAHILCDDGKAIFTTSRGILKALRDGAKIYGKGRWEPAALLEIREVKAKRGDALIGIWRGRKQPLKTAKKA